MAWLDVQPDNQLPFPFDVPMRCQGAYDHCIFSISKGMFYVQTRMPDISRLIYLVFPHSQADPVSTVHSTPVL